MLTLSKATIRKGFADAMAGEKGTTKLTFTSHTILEMRKTKPDEMFLKIYHNQDFPQADLDKVLELWPEPLPELVAITTAKINQYYYLFVHLPIAQQMIKNIN